MRPLLLLLALGLAAARDAFTPEDMLEAPRPHDAIPDPSDTKAIAVVDKWDGKRDVTTRSVYLLPLSKSALGPELLFETNPSEASELLWIKDEIAYLNGTTLQTQTRTLLEFPPGINPGSIKFSHGRIFFSAQVWTDGNFSSASEHDHAWERRGDTAMVFDELFIRHWDTWRVPGKAWTIGSADLNHGTLVNVLNDTGLTSAMDPIEFDVDSTRLVFVIKTPHLNPATHTRTDVYSIPTSGGRAKHLSPHKHGAISSVSIGDDGRVAWLEMAKDGYESDRNVVVVYDKGAATRWTEAWDRSPGSVKWAGESLLLLAYDEGREIPFYLSQPGHLPVPLIRDGSTTSIHELSPGTFLFTRNSLVSPSDAFLLDVNAKGGKGPAIHRLTDWSGTYLGDRLDGLQGESFWFKGSEERDVHAWIVKPSGWTKGAHAKSYPLAFLIHGGPQSAWLDNWGLRWNVALFAAQGYFTVAVNPTGSTGYGQEFTDRIQKEWGSRPFKDLLAGYHAVLKEFPEIDPGRTAALGASYGGYMVNWIQGHNDLFGFSALVCHDGIFDTTDAFYTTEEVWFPHQDFGGSPVEERGTYERWNPMNHVSEWSTPELVIHSGKDYRLVDSQGIAAFTALQYNGVPSRFLYFPDENHWVLKASNSRRWHHEVFRWLDEWVGEGKNGATTTTTTATTTSSESDSESGLELGLGLVVQQ